MDSKNEHPIGIMPKHMWIRMRFWDLAEACNRYIVAGKHFPEEWREEMREHLRSCEAVTKDIEPRIVKQWTDWLVG